MFEVVRLVVNLLTLLVILHVILSYLVPPYNRVREVVDRLVEPMLAPIRRIMPYTGGVDFSPLVLILIIQLLGRLILSLMVF
ncbi:MAG TPA: YggT family protein [Anaerolineales bacterium]|nr:YggT family protein [Anaerolineales bacterium]